MTSFVSRIKVRILLWLLTVSVIEPQDWSSISSNHLPSLEHTQYFSFSGSLFMLIGGLEFLPFFLQFFFFSLLYQSSFLIFPLPQKPSLITRVFPLSFSLHFYSSIYCVSTYVTLIIQFTVRYLCFNYNCMFSVIIKFWRANYNNFLLYPKPNKVLCE